LEERVMAVPEGKSDGSENHHREMESVRAMAEERRGEERRGKVKNWSLRINSGDGGGVSLRE
jgi:hypothetical protein